jgi:hypothetical protein
MDEVKTGYMCQTDWNWELGEALGGTTIYPTIEDLKTERKCTDSCGVVKVKIELIEVVEPGKEWGK